MYTDVMTNRAERVYTRGMAQHENRTAHRLFIIPAAETSTTLLARAIRDYLTETVEASEDITLEALADGAIGLTAHWADAEWCETLAEGIENATGATCWIAYRNAPTILKPVR